MKRVEDTPIHTITLPWPSSDLSSNARVHWRVRAKATKTARTDAYYTTPKGVDCQTIVFAYHPPDRLCRDAQNMPAMLKPYIDGIADRMGRDDSLFSCVFPSGFEDVVPGGKIVVRFYDPFETPKH